MLYPTPFDHPAYACAASVISFSLRAAAANRRALRENETLETYFQTALSDGFINLGEGILSQSCPPCQRYEGIQCSPLRCSPGFCY